MRPHTINEQIDLSWENPDQTSTNSTSSTKNPDLSKPKSTQPANQRTPKAKFGTTNLSRILTAHQTLRPYLYPQKQLPQIVLYDPQGSYQSTTWPLRPRLRPLLPPEEEDPVPHQHQLQPLRPPQQWTSFSKSKQPLMQLLVAQEEEEEDRVHLDHREAEELRQTLQHLLHKYQSQRQQMSAPWEQPHAPS